MTIEKNELHEKLHEKLDAVTADYEKMVAGLKSEMKANSEKLTADFQEKKDAMAKTLLIRR